MQKVRFQVQLKKHKKYLKGLVYSSLRSDSVELCTCCFNKRIQFNSFVIHQIL